MKLTNYKPLSESRLGLMVRGRAVGLIFSGDKWWVGILVSFEKDDDCWKLRFFPQIAIERDADLVETYKAGDTIVFPTDGDKVRVFAPEHKCIPLPLIDPCVDVALSTRDVLIVRPTHGCDDNDYFVVLSIEPAAIQDFAMLSQSNGAIPPVAK